MSSQSEKNAKTEQKFIDITAQLDSHTQDMRALLRKRNAIPTEFEASKTLISEISDRLCVMAGEAQKICERYREVIWNENPQHTDGIETDSTKMPNEDCCIKYEPASDDIPF